MLFFFIFALTLQHVCHNPRFWNNFLCLHLEKRAGLDMKPAPVHQHKASSHNNQNFVVLPDGFKTHCKLASTMSYPSTMPWGFHSSTPLVTQGKGDSRATEAAGTREAAALRLLRRRCGPAQAARPVAAGGRAAETPQSPADSPPRPVSQRPCSADG